MIDIRNETAIIDSPSGMLRIQYLLRGIPRKQGYAYGIAVCNRCSLELSYLPDITTDRQRALALFERLVRGQVTTVTFRDIVEDFLAEL